MLMGLYIYMATYNTLISIVFLIVVFKKFHETAEKETKYIHTPNTIIVDINEQIKQAHVYVCIFVYTRNAKKKFLKRGHS